MADYCRKNGISDGNCGMRSLIDWIMEYGDPRDPHAAPRLTTIVSKATSDEEDRDALKATVLEPYHSRPSAKKAV